MLLSLLSSELSPGSAGAVPWLCSSLVPSVEISLLMGSTTPGCCCCWCRRALLELWSRTSQAATSPLTGGLLPATETSLSLTFALPLVPDLF